ncbi:AAA family ATPase [Nocardia carnea]|uniref:AAA family ATPase n=1 Tax=Nocardia carnea TaxID=37328 RepID=UPI00245687EA|nr:AAA family ATPase [Nocardia carnea]
MRRAPGAGHYLQAVRLGSTAGTTGYPYDLPAVRYLTRSGGLSLPPGVTFLVGENGSGKSTLLEAIAVAAGLNPEGGSQNYRFATRATESELGGHLVLRWGVHKPRSRFFLRAESFYNVATESERLGPSQLAALGGSPHTRSHGESFVDLMRHRFFPGGLYLMDEPEAALSPRGCMTALARIAELVSEGCQFVVATHSPILLAVPGATIYQIDEGGTIDSVEFDQASPVTITREFLARPQHYLRYLVEEQ